MKKIFLTLMACLTGASASAQDAQLSGNIKGMTSGNLMLIQYVGDDVRYDTLQVAADGNFQTSVKVLAPATANLQAEEMRATTTFFLEPGMKANLKIGIKEVEQDGEKYNKMVVDYHGDNRDCYDYLNGDADDLFERWPFERIDTLTFATYRELFLKDIDREKARVMSVKSLNFRRQILQQLQEQTSASLCRYAWSEADKMDPDFVAWIESFDRNDPDQIDMAGRYLRWYGSCHPDEPGKNSHESYFNRLRRLFFNQDVINSFADEYIQSVLKDAPEDMDDAYEAYLKTSTNEQAHAEAKRLYDHYSKLKKGAVAADFEMYDKEGKRYTLKDLSGRAVYIDCWATWCGPCVAETPYMEKLYQHFKGDKRLEIISISLDQNRRLWERKVAADKPEWRQFICPDNFKSQLCKNYDIDGIPRFLMFDREGRIISLDAPRPSHEGIVEWIEQNLR